MAASLPPLPSSLKAVQHYLKTAIEHEKRDPVVAYYCLLYAAQKAMEIDRKSPEAKKFLISLMDLMEQEKTSLAHEETITSELVGQAHVEGYALKLFVYADNEDRAGRFGKNVVKSFYTAGMLFDVLTNFGELSDDIQKNRKYAKWKAAYIHNCLKNGETPVAGPVGGDEGEEEGSEGGVGGATSAIGFEQPGPSVGYHQPPAASHPPSQPQLPPQGGPSYPPASLYPSHQPGIPGQPVVQVPILPSPQAQPYAPPTTPSDPTAARWQPPPNPAGMKLEAIDYQKAMKLCKYASSALQYEDSKTAIENLGKALNLLTTGKE